VNLPLKVVRTTAFCVKTEIVLFSPTVDLHPAKWTILICKSYLMFYNNQIYDRLFSQNVYTSKKKKKKILKHLIQKKKIEI